MANRTAILAMLASACSQSAERADFYSVRDSAGIQIVTIDAAPWAIPEWSLQLPATVHLDGNAAPYFQRITSARWLSDGDIVVLDRQADQLHLFADDGAFLRSFGRSGDGPGEFANIATVTVAPGDSIIVLDRYNGRVSVFHPADGFVRDFSTRSDSAGISANDAWVLSADRWALLTYREDLSWMDRYDGKPFISEAELGVSIIDAAGTRRAGPIDYPGGRFAQFAWGSGGLPLSPDPVVSGGNRRVVVGTGESWELHVLDESLGLTAIVRWPSNREPITDADRAEVMQSIRTSMAPLGNDRMEEILDISLSAEAVPAFRPAHGRILVGADGTIWVARFEPYKSEALWYFLDPAHRPAGRIQLPEQAWLLAASNRALMYVLADSLDVQSVYVAGIRRD
jgi:hypothetical protein